jgi:hypothetical protein
MNLLSKGLVALAGVLSLATGCGSGSPPGELVVEVVTDMSLPKDIDSVRVQILGTNGVTYNDQTYTVGPDGLHIPATIGILAGNPTATALVRVTAIHNNQALILREATSEVPSDHQALLRLPLEFLCTGSATDTSMLGSPSTDTIQDNCPSGQTCILGTCSPSTVSVATLPPYNAANVFGGGDGGGNGNCFDTVSCFASPLTVTPGSGCTVALPAGVNAADINVALETTGANVPGICNATGQCFVPVDMSATEGWTLSGSTLTLPPGVCTPFKKTTPFTVVLSSSCPSKVPQIPTCGPWSSAGNAEHTLDGGVLRGRDGGAKDAARDATLDARPDASMDSGGDAATPAALTGLLLAGGTLSPAFSPTVFAYTVNLSATSLGLPFTVSPGAPLGSTVTVDGEPLALGMTLPIALNLLTSTTITVVVTPPDPDGSTPPGATYTLSVPPLQEVYLKAANPLNFAELGASMAISSDGSTLVVGAPFEQSDALGINGDGGMGEGVNEGAAYVFVRAAGSDGGAVWTQQAYLKASQDSYMFGSAIALSADGNTLAVAAAEEPGLETPNGGVYLFIRTGTTWAQQQHLQDTDATATQFGTAIALSGDGSTLAVGASGDSSAATGIDGDAGQSGGTAGSSGAVYTFTNTGGEAGSPWVKQHFIKAPNTEPSAYFGGAVALSSDGSTLAIGAYGEASPAIGLNGNEADASAPGAGAVYIYLREGTGWSATPTYVKASNTAAGSAFGAALALSADGTVLAIGASSESSASVGINSDGGTGAANNAGSAYVYSFVGAAWAYPPTYFKAQNTQQEANFGSAVALSSDGGTLVVGAPHENSLATGVNPPDAGVGVFTSSGAVYLFSRRGAAWTQQAYVKPPFLDYSNSDNPEDFGVSVSLSPSGSILAVGATGDPTTSGINGGEDDASAQLSSVGAVHVYR